MPLSYVALLPMPGITEPLAFYHGAFGGEIVQQDDGGAWLKPGGRDLCPPRPRTPVGR
jgi:hypothetical protein